MEYEIVNIQENEMGFEVDVKYTFEGKEKEMRFSFAADAWEGEKWKKSIDNYFSKLAIQEKIKKEKAKYIKKHVVKPETSNPIESAVTRVK